MFADHPNPTKDGPVSKSEITAGDKLAYHIDDACQIIGLSRASIYKLMGEGKLRSVKVAGRRLIPAEALRALLQTEAA
jgi:excisionase family DNA binding protein